MKVRRREPSDVLKRDGETAVLVDGAVVRLGPLSSEIFDLCATPVDVADLARALARMFGDPADRPALDATANAVADLVTAGVLTEVRSLDS